MKKIVLKNIYCISKYLLLIIASAIFTIRFSFIETYFI